MEEKKIGSKEVKMNTVKADVNNQVEEAQEDPQKIIDDLYNHNKQLEAYVQRLHKQMQQMDFSLQTTRLSFLFKVVDLANNASTYNFSSDFVNTCVKEIEESLTIPEAPDKESDNQN